MDPERQMNEIARSAALAVIGIAITFAGILVMFKGELLFPS